MLVYESDLIDAAAVVAQRGAVTILVVRKEMLSKQDLQSLRAVLDTLTCSTPLDESRGLTPKIPKPNTGHAESA